jgi:hypothetical protein
MPLKVSTYIIIIIMGWKNKVKGANEMKRQGFEIRYCYSHYH